MVLKIRERRESLGLAQGPCAAAMGVSQSVLSMWETESALPRTRDLPLIARVLECSISELFVEDPFDDLTA